MSPTGRVLDAVIVGGGPAGSAAATTLARSGLEVLLIDRATFPRDKCCGDGLTTGALRRLELLGLPLGEVASFTPATDLELVSPSGRREEARLANRSGTFAGVARRIDLDDALINLARRAGVEVREGAPFEGVRANDDGLVVEFSGDKVRAKFLIAADGAWSPVRKAVEAAQGPTPLHSTAGGEPPGEWHAFRTYTTEVRPAALGALSVIFDERLLPGYAWSFPFSDGSANVGICLRRAPGVHGRELARAWTESRELPSVRACIGRQARFDEPVRTWPIPAGINRAHMGALGGRILFVGDAAHAADPFTGEGVAQALETGIRAAQAIASAHGKPDAAMRRYVREVSRQLVREQDLDALLSRAMTHPRSARGLVRFIGMQPRIGSLVGRWLFEDFPRLMPIEPSTWRPGRFSAPGPYADPD